MVPGPRAKSGGGKKSESGYVLKVEPAGPAGGLDGECERKIRIKDDIRLLSCRTESIELSSTETGKPSNKVMLDPTLCLQGRAPPSRV